MARTTSETTKKVRAYGRLERLNADIREMQEAEAERRKKYEDRLTEKQAERDAAAKEHTAFLESELAKAKAEAKS